MSAGMRVEGSSEYFAFFLRDLHQRKRKISTRRGWREWRV